MLELATAPCTWGVDFADAPGNPPWQAVLDDMAASGLRAVEVGPVGYLPEDPATVRALLDERGLQSAGSFIFDDVHDPEAAERLLALTGRVCRFIVASGGTLLSLIDKPDEIRVATAGRPAAAPRLSDDRWRAMIDLLDRMAAVARGMGVRPMVHPHVGGYIETEDEIERLAADTDLELCLDTGHLTYARMDPVAMLERHAGRLAHVHLKDIRPAVLARVDREQLTFWEAIREGIFCPLGEGMVDIPAVVAGLDRLGYRGFATIEQDRVPGSGAPLDDVRASIAVVRAAEGAGG